MLLWFLQTRIHSTSQFVSLSNIHIKAIFLKKRLSLTFSIFSTFLSTFLFQWIIWIATAEIFSHNSWWKWKKNERDLNTKVENCFKIYLWLVPFIARSYHSLGPWSLSDFPCFLPLLYMALLFLLISLFGWFVWSVGWLWMPFAVTFNRTAEGNLPTSPLDHRIGRRSHRVLGQFLKSILRMWGHVKTSPHSVQRALRWKPILMYKSVLRNDML